MGRPSNSSIKVFPLKSIRTEQKIYKWHQIKPNKISSAPSDNPSRFSREAFDSTTAVGREAFDSTTAVGRLAGPSFQRCQIWWSIISVKNCVHEDFYFCERVRHKSGEKNFSFARTDQRVYEALWKIYSKSLQKMQDGKSDKIDIIPKQIKWKHSWWSLTLPIHWWQSSPAFSISWQERWLHIQSCFSVSRRSQNISRLVYY